MENARGFSIQEIETKFEGHVDRYFRALFAFAFEKEPGEDFVFRPEEAYAESLSIPYVTIRGGKFRAFLGHHNQLHAHQFPFINAPLIYDEILGEEGLNEIGVSAAVEVPVPWHLQFAAQAFSATNENLYDGDNANDFTGLFYLKNGWNLSDQTTLEAIGSYGVGPNVFDGLTHLFSGSTVLTWRPKKDRTVSWAAEYLQSDRQKSLADRRVGGIASWLRWKFAKKWWIQGRGEYLGLPKPDDGAGSRYSGLLAWAFSDYSALRLQYDAWKEVAASRFEHFVTLQWNVSIGNHTHHTH